MLLSTLKVSGFSFEIFVTETKCMGADQIIKQELHLNTFYQLPIINFLLIISSHTLGYLQIRVSREIWTIVYSPQNVPWFSLILILI